MPQSELDRLFYERKKLSDEMRGRPSTSARSKKQLGEPFKSQVWHLKLCKDHVSVGQRKGTFPDDRQQWNDLIPDCDAHKPENSELAFYLRDPSDWHSFQQVVQFVEDHGWMALETNTLDSIVKARVINEGANVDQIVSEDGLGEEDPHEIDPDLDMRERMLRPITLRTGQGAFRNQLLAAYQATCAITGCDCADALEAAHIYPYKGEHSNHVTNGMLLRADIHKLFDLGLISVDPKSWTVEIDVSLRATQYASTAHAHFKLPLRLEDRPSTKALLTQKATALSLGKLFAA